MANTISSRTGAVVGTVVSFKIPHKRDGLNLYLKYTKGDGTSVKVQLTFIDPDLSDTDEYKPVYFDSSMNPVEHSFTLTASANLRIPVPLALGESTVKATVTFTGGATQVLVVDFRAE